MNVNAAFTEPVTAVAGPLVIGAGGSQIGLLLCPHALIRFAFGIRDIPVGHPSAIHDLALSVPDPQKNRDDIEVVPVC